MNKLLQILFLILILGGCASSESTGGKTRLKISDIDWDNVVTPEGEKLYCRKEMITGTHRKTMTCLTKAEMDTGRKNSDLYMTKMKATPEAGISGG